MSAPLLSSDRGSATPELVVAIPLVLLMILLVAQFTMWAHATHIAQVAAAQALADARVAGGSAAAGTATADRVLAQLAAGPLHGARITTNRTNDFASVSITGTTTSIVPLLTLPVHAEAAGPVERFTQ